MVSSASTTNDAVSALVVLPKYCANPPLLTSDSSAQMPEKTFCGIDYAAKFSRPNRDRSDPDRSIRIRFLSIEDTSAGLASQHPRDFSGGQLPAAARILAAPERRETAVAQTLGLCPQWHDRGSR